VPAPMRITHPSVEHQQTDRRASCGGGRAWQTRVLPLVSVVTAPVGRIG